MQSKLATWPLILASSVLLLSACSQSAPPAGEEMSEGKSDAAAMELAPGTKVAKEFAAIEAPAGRYTVDGNHAYMGFEVTHLGLAGYHARFEKYDISVDIDPENIGGASVKVSIDPKSVSTGYPGDYKATHADSPFQSWDEALAMSDKFFNAGKHPTIEFVSTRVEQTGDKTLNVVGDLTLLGQTKPVTLKVTLGGVLEKHPFANVPAIGLSARGTFKRSDFGMTHLLGPTLVADEVTLHFEGEFRQAPPPEPEAA